MKLVPDWKDAWRWHTTHFAAVIAVLPGAWASMPDDVKAYLPEGAEPWVLGVLGLAVIVGRLRKQA